MSLLLNTDFKDLKLFRRGKVRDVYDLGNELLVVSTDRISCFDVVLSTPIPDKGAILTRISQFWFNLTEKIISNHLINAAPQEVFPGLAKYNVELTGRSMLVKKAVALPIECIVRGYLSGSAWKEYQEKGDIGGRCLPGGLQESEELPEVLFTPSTKADFGHDINITEEEASLIVGKDIFQKVKTASLNIYKSASVYAESKGIIIADTKFEFGLLNNEVILIDEILTPDSSRFWPLSLYRPGGQQESFDKQFVRDYLESLKWWNKEPPAPDLPEQIVRKTSEKYAEAYKLLTGKAL